MKRRKMQTQFKRKICIGIMLLMVTAAAVFGMDYYRYRQVMDTVRIIHYISGSGSGYSTVYLTAVVSEENYHEEETVRTIRRYVAGRNGEVPDTLQIVLYGSMEELKSGDSYFEGTFREK